MNTEKGLKLVKGVMDVSRETEERLTAFHDLLQQWQARINLISPTTVGHIWERHIADSMQSCALMEDADHIVDIGSGAGFPGLVMAIVMAQTSKNSGKNSDKRVELVESNGKKCAFLNAVVRETGLKRAGLEITVHHGRVEDVLPTLDVPDLVSARALAPLNDLLEMTDCFLSHGSVGLFPKGRDHGNEIAKAQEKWAFQLSQHKSRFENGSVLLQISDLKRK